MKRAIRATLVTLVSLPSALACALALATVPAAAAPDSGDVGEARVHYARGQALYGDGKFAEARAELDQAYALAPTYRLLYDLALASDGEGDRSAAIGFLQRYLAEGGAEIEASRRAQAEELLSRLRARVALVTIRTNVVGDAGVSVDDQPYGEVTTTPLVLLPGARKIWVTKAGFYPASQLVLLKEGEAIDVAFELKELPHPKVERPPWWRSPAVIPALAALVAACIGIALFQRRRREASKILQLNPYQDEDTKVLQPTPAQTNVIRIDPESTAPSASPLKLEVAAATDTGRVKPSNQDSHLVDTQKSLFVVADGIGGFAGGEVASATAVETIGAYFAGKRGVGLLTHVPATAGALASAAFRANGTIRRKQAANPNIADMGCTCVAAAFSRDARELAIVHVGDSRVYRLRSGRLVQLTTDHTMAELGVTGRRAQHLSRALGTELSPKLDILLGQPEAGDVYLLCCDGLTKMLSDEALTAVLQRGAPPAQTVAELVAAANDAGGLDNITALVVRVSQRT